MPLRRRLFLLVFVPIALLYLGFGIYGAFQTRSDLIADLDDELVVDTETVAELLATLETAQISEAFESSNITTSRLTAIVTVETGEVLVAPATKNGTDEPLPSDETLTPIQLVKNLGEPFEFTSADGSLNYRAFATRIDGGRLVLTAAPLDNIDRLTRRFIAGTLVTSLFLIAAMGAVVYVAIRSGLKPLRNFVATTTRVAEGDFTERADADQPDPAFAEISRATNHMLDRVEASYEKERFGREHLNDLVANAAHELRTPLAAIRGTVDMQKMGILDSEDKLRTAFKGLDDNSTRMESVVEDLIVIARAENLRLDTLGTTVSIIDLRGILSDRVDALRRKYPARTIEYESVENTVEVEVDDGLLGTAIDQVLENAVLHTTDESEVRVELDAHGDNVRIDISDTGEGIPHEIQDTVFDRFVRADTSRARHTGGAGLGLSIAQSIVQSSGGKVILTESTDAGARFTIVLPRFTRGL